VAGSTETSGVRAALAAPSIRRFIASTSVSQVGFMLLVTALFKQAYDLTGDELSIGLVGLAQFLPALALVLVSGMVADRFDRRRVAALALAAHVGCTIALTLYAASDPTAVWPLYLIALGLGTADAMIHPAVRSMPPTVAPPGMLPRLIALNAATFTGASIVGPAVGGLLYSVDPALAFGVAGVMIALSIVPMLRITFVRTPDRDRERPTLHTAMEGLRFVRRTPIVLAAISLDLFAVLFGGAVALIPSVAEERLGVGDVAYGWLRAAPGIGAAVMAIVLAVRPIRRRIGPVLLVVVAVFGAATVVFGVTRSYLVAFVALIVLSGADMVSMFIRGSLVPLVTPDEQLGRVVAVEGVFIGASNELGAFESGVAASALGLPVAIAGGGIATLVIAGAWAALFPSLRRIDTFDALEAQRHPVAVRSPEVAASPIPDVVDLLDLPAAGHTETPAGRQEAT
jgi:MFS family permease